MKWGFHLLPFERDLIVAATRVSSASLYAEGLLGKLHLFKHEWVPAKGGASAGPQQSGGQFLLPAQGWRGPLTWALHVKNFSGNASRDLGKVTGPAVERPKF